MRFLIGLIFGAGLIFAVAGALGSGSGGLAARLPAWLDGVALQVGDWLSLPPRPGRAASFAGLRSAASASAWLR